MAWLGWLVVSVSGVQLSLGGGRTGIEQGDQHRYLDDEFVATGNELMTKRVLAWLLAVVWLLVCLSLAGAAAYGIVWLSAEIGIVKQSTNPRIVRGIYWVSSAI